MSSVLYYSNYCQHSKETLSKISKYEDVVKNIHFICIDNRIQKLNKTYIVLENGNEIIMPETITEVPSLLLLNNDYKLITGNDICQYFEPKERIEIQKATLGNMEPLAFAMSGFGSGGGIGGGISSDNYSFVDTTTNEMDIGHYSAPNDECSIAAPVEEINDTEPKIDAEEISRYENEYKNDTTTFEQTERRQY